MTVTYHSCNLQSLIYSSDQKALFKVQGTDVTLSSPNVAVLGEREPLTNCFMKFCLKLEELFHAIWFFFGMERNIVWKKFAK